MTFGDELRRAHGHPAGFDVLRLGLAAGVIVQHSVNVTAGQDAAIRLFLSPWRGLFEPILPMFFALSGFLVAGSLQRCRSLIGFCGLRALRIVPALAVEVIVSALLLGPLVTNLPLGEYVGGDAFRAYFLNVVGLIHYRLPGVFLDNPDPQTVNAQLWTVPFELECYAALAAAALVGLTRRRGWFVASLLAIQAAVLVHALVAGPSRLEVTAGGRPLVFCFLWGVAFFMWRDRIPCHRGLLIVAWLLTEVLIWVPGGSGLLAIPICYLTISAGLARLPKPAVLFDGDYSYGLYLYGFPIQQTLVHLMPGMRWFTNAPVALLVAFAFARASWWTVERRALLWRPALHRLESGLLARLPPRITPALALQGSVLPPA